MYSPYEEDTDNSINDGLDFGIKDRENRLDIRQDVDRGFNESNDFKNGPERIVLVISGGIIIRASKADVKSCRGVRAGRRHWL